MITVMHALLAWTASFLFLTVVLLYLTFLSRALPVSVGAPFAWGLDYVGGALGACIGALVLTAVLWWLVGRIFEEDTAGGLGQRVGVRATGDAAVEEQAVNATVGEISAAAEMPRPGVWWFDGSSANAVAMGDSPDRSALLMSRVLLNVLEPAQVRAVVNHLLGSIANGDLRITSQLLRGLGLTGAALMLLDLPLNPRSRHAARILTRVAFPSRAKVAPDSKAAADAVSVILHPDGLDSLTLFLRKLVGEENDLRSILITVVQFLLLPFLVARIAAGVIVTAALLLLIGPAVTLILRSRRRLADEVSLQLTNDADALAGALGKLYAVEHAVAEAGWAEMGFVVGPEAPSTHVLDRAKARWAKALATANGYSTRLRLKPTLVASAETSAASIRAAADHVFVFGFHPPLNQRLQRLRALGATSVAVSEQPDRSGRVVVAALLVGITCVLVFAVPALR
jgi:Zn-dependent protease with chaperone function